MFALGMNNNGTGLVLASMAMADHPRVMLPIIFYNMVQHLVAGGAYSLIGRRPGGAATADERRRPTLRRAGGRPRAGHREAALRPP